MDAILQEVNAHVQAGATPPKLGRYRGVARLVAKAVARCVQFLARPVTIEQRAFNQATFEALRSLGERVEQLKQLGGRVEMLEQTQELLSDKVEHGDASLAEYGSALADYQRDLRQLDAILQRHTAFLEECEAGIDEQNAVGRQLLDGHDELLRGHGALITQVSPLSEQLGRLQRELLAQQRRLSTALDGPAEKA